MRNLCELQILLGISAVSAGMGPGRQLVLKSKFLRQQSKVSSPSLATEGANKTQERVLGSSSLATSPSATEHQTTLTE